jgi:DNA modification methylase
VPTLDWIGKRAVVNHHRELPYRLLHCDREASVGEPGGGNLLVEGDNLHALKALLPYYAGKVKCIYIDPPYNTGNEGWVYNDNVNAPEIQKWLGETVGKEAEDLSRHDKWLCMMYPRLALLRDFLREDGIIFVNVDDTESHHLRCVMDELFGASNLLAVVSWEKRYTRSNNAKLFYSLKDTVIVYRRSPAVQFLREPRTEKSDAIYKNPDNDPRGAWTSSSYVNPATREKRKNLVYPILNPHRNIWVEHPTHAWKYEPAEHERHVRENLLWWGKKGDAKYPRLKNFLKKADDEAQGLVPIDLWHHESTGTTDEGGAELKAIFGNAVFQNPKPTKLIRRLLTIATEPGDLVVDSFAGSGTTGNAVLQLNQESTRQRRFILIQMPYESKEQEISDNNIARDITAERLKRVINGYAETPGLGGSFRYCKIGEPLFDADGRLRENVKWGDLAHHLWFAESGEPWMPQFAKSLQSLTTGGPMIGVAPDGRAIYLLYSSVLPEPLRNGASTLSSETLGSLAPFAGPRVVYADACTLRASALSRERIAFKQIPYQVQQQ